MSMESRRGSLCSICRKKSLRVSLSDSSLIFFTSFRVLLFLFFEGTQLNVSTPLMMNFSSVGQHQSKCHFTDSPPCSIIL